MLCSRAADVEVGAGEVRDGVRLCDVDHDDGVGFQAFESSNAGVEDSFAFLPAVEVWVVTLFPLQRFAVPGRRVLGLRNSPS